MKLPGIDEIPKNKTSWVHKDLDLKKSIIEGYGLFSKAEIKKNTIVSVFGGKIYTTEEMSKLDEESFILNTATQVNSDFYLGPPHENGFEWGFFINHSCKPNSKIWRSVFLITIKELKPNDELTFDYGHSHNSFLNFPCRCGAENCRKFIGNNDFKEEKYLKANKQHMTQWLLETIE